jgi:hypothetical protein
VVYVGDNKSREVIQSFEWTPVLDEKGRQKKGAAGKNRK